MKGIRYITEGAVLLALFISLLVCSLYLPVVGSIFTLALSIPFVIYTVRHGWKKAVALLAVGLLLTLLFGTVLALPVTFSFGTSGIVMGYLYQRNKSRYLVLLGGTVIFSLNLVLQYVAANLLLNVNLLQQLEQVFDDSIKTAVKTFESMGQAPDPSQIEQLQQAFNMLKYMFPSLIVMSAFVFAFVTQLIASTVLKKMKYDVEKFPPFSKLRLPKSVLWYYLLALILSMPFFNFEEGSFLFIAVINLIIILQTLVLIQGYSFIFYFCGQKDYPKAVPVVILILSLFIPILLQIIRILGIIDLGFNLRRVKE